MATIKCMLTHFFKIPSFVLEKKEMYTALEQLEGE